MSIIKDVEHIANCCGEGTNWNRILLDAVALLCTHPDNQPNEPLTLEELRDLHGKPVWIHRFEDGQGWWSVVRISDTRLYTDYGAWCDLRDYGKSWVAYCRPPKEDER